MTLPAPRRTLRRRRLARTGALSGALLLALTACSGGGADSGASSASTTTTAPAASSTSAAASSSTGGASASASDATTSGAAGEYVPASSKGPAQNVPKPVMPAAVKENTPEGAEAAVKYWWEAVNYLQQTNDPEPLKSISDMEACDFCASYVTGVNNLYSEEGWLIADEPQIHYLSSAPVNEAMDLTSRVTNPPARAFGPHGEIGSSGSPSGPSASDQLWRFAATYDSTRNHWVVNVAELIESVK